MEQIGMLIENGSYLWNNQGDRNDDETDARMNSDLKNLLQKVSRSFSLSLFALPPQGRDFVGATYLVARVADTLADSGRISTASRLTHLQAWENAICSRPSAKEKWKFNDSVGSFDHSEQQLLLESDRILKLFHQFPDEQKVLGQEVLAELTRGMNKIVQQVKGASFDQPIFINSSTAEFDHYCYQHAGCVGPFWSRAFGLPADLELFAIDYGKALERVNILRDVIEDRKRGRILLAKDELEKFNLVGPEPWHQEAWPNFVSEYVSRTKPFLQHAANFCNAIPYRKWRLRFASSLPLRIGLECLKLYGAEKTKQETTKISRAKIKSIVWGGMADTVIGRNVRGWS